ncbi:hypothetical protein BX600DRAFT_159134 [Xylariales sp. PMI_506]|nr:hypothetical protein BX600DRAFT_159134 [Xylariales sp. PMI_506]
MVHFSHWVILLVSLSEAHQSITTMIKTDGQDGCQSTSNNTSIMEQKVELEIQKQNKRKRSVKKVTQKNSKLPAKQEKFKIDSPGSQDGGLTASPISETNRRVKWACARCQTKKMKCDGAFPCKRCLDDRIICSPSIRRRLPYKESLRGYIETLETTQLILGETVQKLYSMIRQGNRWEQQDPELDEDGRPALYSIATLLGCMRACAVASNGHFTASISAADSCVHDLATHGGTADNNSSVSNPGPESIGFEAKFKLTSSEHLYLLKYRHGLRAKRCGYYKVGR